MLTENAIAQMSPEEIAEYKRRARFDDLLSLYRACANDPNVDVRPLLTEIAAIVGIDAAVFIR